MKNILLISILSLSMTACLQTRTAVQEIEQKKQIQDQVVTLQRNNADQSSRFLDLESNVRSMNGRIESLEAQLERAQNSKNEIEKESSQKNSELEKKIALLQESVIKMDSEIQELRESLSEQSKKSNSNVQPEKKSNSNESPDFANAETLFEEKEWKKAILNYNKYRDNNPKGKKFAEATYKMGVCFQELNKKEEAKVFYEEVIAKFPKSKEAERAQYRLKNLKK